jgi:hypothetical protein
MLEPKREPVQVPFYQWPKRLTDGDAVVDIAGGGASELQKISDRQNTQRPNPEI